MPVRCRSRCSICSDVLLAVAAKIAQIVERAIDSGANHAAIVQRDGRLVLQSRDYARVQISELIALRVQRLQSLGGNARQRCTHAGQLCQGSSQRQQVARVGSLQGDPAQQTLKIENAFERAAQFFPRNHVPGHALDRIEPLIDLADVD